MALASGRKQGSEEERKNLTWRVAEQEVVWLDVGIHQAAVVQEGDSHLRELICYCIVWVLFYFRRSIPVHCSADRSTAVVGTGSQLSLQLRLLPAQQLAAGPAPTSS